MKVIVLTVIMFLFRQIQKIENDFDRSDCFRMYNCLQLLEETFNAFLMRRVVPALMICSPGIQVIAQYVCINHNISMPGFLIFPLMGLDASIANILIYTLASKVWSGSEKIRQSLRDNVIPFQKSKSLRKRQIASLSLLKIKFGSNYIDRGTSLNIQNFCFNQTMSLTLIKARKSTA